MYIYRCNDVHSCTHPSFTRLRLKVPLFALFDLSFAFHRSAALCKAKDSDSQKYRVSSSSRPRTNDPNANENYGGHWSESTFQTRTQSFLAQPAFHKPSQLQPPAPASFSHDSGPIHDASSRYFPPPYSTISSLTRNGQTAHHALDYTDVRITQKNRNSQIPPDGNVAYTSTMYPRDRHSMTQTTPQQQNHPDEPTIPLGNLYQERKHQNVRQGDLSQASLQAKRPPVFAPPMSDGMDSYPHPHFREETDPATQPDLYLPRSLHTLVENSSSCQTGRESSTLTTYLPVHLMSFCRSDQEKQEYEKHQRHEARVRALSKAPTRSKTGFHLDSVDLNVDDMGAIDAERIVDMSHIVFSSPYTALYDRFDDVVRFQPFSQSSQTNCPRSVPKSHVTGNTNPLGLQQPLRQDTRYLHLRFSDPRGFLFALSSNSSPNGMTVKPNFSTRLLTFQIRFLDSVVVSEPVPYTTHPLLPHDLQLTVPLPDCSLLYKALYPERSAAVERKKILDCEMDRDEMLKTTGNNTSEALRARVSLQNISSLTALLPTTLHDTKDDKDDKDNKKNENSYISRREKPGCLPPLETLVILTEKIEICVYEHEAALMVSSQDTDFVQPANRYHSITSPSYDKALEQPLYTTRLLSCVHVDWRQTLIHGSLLTTVQFPSLQDASIAIPSTQDELDELDQVTPMGCGTIHLKIFPLKGEKHYEHDEHDDSNEQSRTFRGSSTIPVYVPMSLVMRRLAAEHQHQKAVTSRLHALARAWWRDLPSMGASPAVFRRFVKLFVKDEAGTKSFVTSFIKPVILTPVRLNGQKSMLGKQYRTVTTFDDEILDFEVELDDSGEKKGGQHSRKEMKDLFVGDNGDNGDYGGSGDNSSTALDFLPTPLHAARFVSLFSHQKPGIGSGSSEQGNAGITAYSSESPVWRSLSVILTQRSGSTVELALLLCSLLLGYGLNAFVVTGLAVLSEPSNHTSFGKPLSRLYDADPSIGTGFESRPELGPSSAVNKSNLPPGYFGQRNVRRHVWVATISPSLSTKVGKMTSFSSFTSTSTNQIVTFWDPVSGKQFVQGRDAHPFLEVHSLFNNAHLYVATGEEKSVQPHRMKFILPVKMEVGSRAASKPPATMFLSSDIPLIWQDCKAGRGYETNVRVVRNNSQRFVEEKNSQKSVLEVTPSDLIPLANEEWISFPSLVLQATNKTQIGGVGGKTRPLALRVPTLSSILASQKLETELRVLLTAHRSHNGFFSNVYRDPCDEQHDQHVSTFPSRRISTPFSPTLRAVMNQALVLYENEWIFTLRGNNSAKEEENPQTCLVRQAFASFVRNDQELISFPMHFTHTNSHFIFRALLSQPQTRDIINSTAPDVRFSVAVKVTVYPENIVSVWVNLAVLLQRRLLPTSLV